METPAQLCVMRSSTELALVWQTPPFSDLPQCQGLQLPFPYWERITPVHTLPQVIYTLQDPRYVVSSCYFSKMCNSYEDLTSFKQFLRDFLNGEHECGLGLTRGMGEGGWCLPLPLAQVSFATVH